MRKDYEKLFTHLKAEEPSAGLFDRIILAIRREREARQTRKLLFSFLFILVVSCIATPLSWMMLINQAKDSGIFYFISTAVSDLGTFFILWQDFSLAILESLPITGIIAFTISIGLAFFTIRLFLYKKRLLLGYLTQRTTV
ncbi:MAG: hypothetical protein PHE52_03140 [Candidatus Pacebacteria bacterium]|nr:hypothetical protein [Candidatus Paceibacterota bacterium]